MTSNHPLASMQPGSTPFDIVRAAFVELRVQSLDASIAFYSGLLGMIVAERHEDCAYLRAWEERQQFSLILREAPVPAVSLLGFQVRREADLDAIATFANDRGLETERMPAGAGAGRMIRLWDPFGFPLAFVHEFTQVEPMHQRFDLQRGAPLLRFDHLNLHSPQLEETLRWWSQLGFRCSEYISTDDPADERITGAWLMRKPTVHDVALTAGTGPRLHHFAYWVPEPAAVIRACDQLAAGGNALSIERGPGRHGVSNAFFVYFRDPDGHRIELYSCDYYTGDPNLQPIRWSVSDPRCRSFWGTETPDSWYDESSLVLGPDARPRETRAANVEERALRSEVLS
jgi:catechol 2,3-dioxygenase